GGIIWEAVQRLPESQSVPDAYVLAVAAAAIAIKTFMYLYQNHMARKLSSGALAADALNHKADIAATSCVLVGTAAVRLGGPTWAPADDVAAMLVGAIMVLVAGHSILDTSSELLDRMPPPELLDPIRQLAAGFPGVRGVDRILGRKLGMHYHIDMHLEVAPGMTVNDAHLLGHDVKDLLMAELPGIGDVTVHLEPNPVIPARPPPA
ncbi:MAG: cation diffusion facilitator family transporter, partial [Gemmatimonadota bacterium]